MSDIALLNPAQDADGCAAMIDACRKRHAVLRQSLSTAVLDRETYLLKIGAANELDRLLADMQREYERRFAV